MPSGTSVPFAQVPFAVCLPDPGEAEICLQDPAAHGHEPSKTAFNATASKVFERLLNTGSDGGQGSRSIGPRSLRMPRSDSGTSACVSGRSSRTTRLPAWLQDRAWHVPCRDGRGAEWRAARSLGAIRVCGLQTAGSPNRQCRRCGSASAFSGPLPGARFFRNRGRAFHGGA
jgi:hypothetical protein